MVDKESCLCNSSAPPSSVKYLPTYQSIKNQVKSGETPVVVKFTTNVYRSTGITIKFTRRKSNLLLGLRTNPKIGQLLGLLFQLTVSFKTRKTVTQLSEFLQKQNPQSHKTWDATRAGMEGSRTVVGCAITSRDLPYIRRICGCLRGVSPSGYSRLYPSKWPRLHANLLNYIYTRNFWPVQVELHVNKLWGSGFWGFNLPTSCLLGCLVSKLQLLCKANPQNFVSQLMSYRVYCRCSSYVSLKM